MNIVKQDARKILSHIHSFDNVEDMKASFSCELVQNFVTEVVQHFLQQ